MAAEAITINKLGPDESGPKDTSREQEQERANQLEREPKRESEPKRDPEPEPEPVPKPKPGEIGLETINHADVTSSDYTKLDLVPMLHAVIELHNMHFLFTDISRRLMTFQDDLETHNMHFLFDPGGIDPEASVQTEIGPEANTRPAFGPDEMVHADRNLQAMRFIFTDIYGSLTTFKSFSRSMHPTDFFLYISHASCLFLHSNGTYLSMHIAVYQCLSMLFERLLINADHCLSRLINTYQTNEFYLQLATQQFQSDV
jgi:hypothetical protein